MRFLRTRFVATLATVAVVALGTTTRPAHAQALPSAKELMDKHDAAMGGRDALAKYGSIHIVGTMSVPAAGMEATLDIYRDKSGKFLQKTVMGPMGEMLSGYDGKTAWAMQPQQGPMILQGTQAEQTKQQADFYGNFHDMARYKSAETVELADFEGRKCYKVKIVKTTGEEGFEFFDAGTGLAAGTVRSTETPMGKVDVLSVLGDYKEFGGLKFPTKITQKTGQYDITLAMTSIEFDKVDPVVFNLPDAVKALVKP